MIDKLDDFFDSLIGFDACKVMDARELWVNQSESFSLENDFFSSGLASAVAYVNPKSKCFIDIHIDKNDKKNLQAERYGGIGVGGNGGGVRCGNAGEIQLKGIGINPLLGDHGDYNHSTGNYSLPEAVSEVINSVVYNEILPVGVAKCYGLISIGKSRFKGDPYGHRLDLAIMAREICIRPAHFLPQPFFKPFSRYKSILMSDVARVRSVNKCLAKKFDNNNAFVMYLGKYLSASASQLAFAKVFRIAHGAYSPSNVCFDGRWLDLTNMTMVPTGTNYAAAKDTIPFLAEPQEPINVVQQVVYNYGKYNFTDLNISPLVNYYYEQYDAYFLHYLIGLFGLDYKVIDHEVGVQERRFIAKGILKVIEGNRQVTVKFPEASGARDLLEPVVEELFFSIYGQPCSERSVPLVEPFGFLVKKAFLNSVNGEQSEFSFVVAAMIRALRKIYFSPCFYLGRMKVDIACVVQAKDKSDISDYINSYAQVAAWLFDKCDTVDYISLFNSPSLTIHYCLLDEVFQLRVNDELLITSARPRQLIACVIQADAFHFDMAGYSFKSDVVRLLDKLDCLVVSQEKSEEKQQKFTSAIA